MKKILLTMAMLFAIAAPLGAQAVDTSATQSDKQVRQRLGWAIAQKRNALAADTAELGHLLVLYDAIHARIVRDSLRALKPAQPPADTTPAPPDTAPAPPPPPDTTSPPPPPPPAGGTVLLQSDWRSQSGNTQSAIKDCAGSTCKWNQISSGAEQNATVVDAPAGFSTHKVLRVASNGHREGWVEPTRSGMGPVPVGSTRNFRWEIAFHEPSTSDHGQHPIQDGGAVSISNWYLGTTNGGSNLRDGEWGVDFVFGGTAWDDSKWTLGTREGQYTPLRKGTVYRMEVQLARFSSTQFRFYVWIYDAQGNLLYDCNAFRVRNGSRTLCGFAQTISNVDSMDRFMVGLNGIGNSPPWPIHSSDQAAVAVVQGLPEGAQIGAYGSVAGEVRR